MSKELSLLPDFGYRAVLSADGSSIGLNSTNIYGESQHLWYELSTKDTPNNTAIAGGLASYDLARAICRYMNCGLSLASANQILAAFSVLQTNHPANLPDEFQLIGCSTIENNSSYQHIFSSTVQDCVVVFEEDLCFDTMTAVEFVNRLTEMEANYAQTVELVNHASTADSPDLTT